MRTLRLCQLFFFGAALLVIDAASAGSSRRPNIIVIIADDLGFHTEIRRRPDDLNDPWIPDALAPQLERIAEQGVRLSRFYTHPSCFATREAFVTGKFPAQFTIDRSAPDLEGGDGNSTIASRFRDAGYQTTFIGKWGLKPYLPSDNGFDYFYGHLSGGINYYTKRILFVGDYDWQRNGTSIDEPQYSTYLIGADARRRIRERDTSRPFFQVVSFNAPHFPSQAPAEVVDFYRHNTLCAFHGFRRCVYFAQVSIMDDEIGRLLDTLEDEGIENETIVVFFSDNGGDHGFGGFNKPLRGQKGMLFEGGVRTRALISWPGVLDAGSTSSQRIQVKDLYATLEAAAGLHRRASRESGNVWRALRRGTPRPRQPFYFNNQVAGRSINCPGCSAPIGFQRSIMTERWKLITDDEYDESGDPDSETRQHFLFRINDDPEELEDLSRQRPFITRVLSAALDRLEDEKFGRRRNRRFPRGR